MDKIEQNFENTLKVIKKYPLLSTAAAFGVGVAVGSLVSFIKRK